MHDETETRKATLWVRIGLSAKMLPRTFSHLGFFYGSIFGLITSLAVFHGYLYVVDVYTRVVILPAGTDESFLSQLDSNGNGMRETIGNLVAEFVGLQGGMKKEHEQLLLELPSLSSKLNGKLEEVQRTVDLHSAALNEQLAVVQKTSAAANWAQVTELAHDERPIGQQMQTDDRRKYVTKYLTTDRPELWRQRKFQRYGVYGFVKFSAYRNSRNRVAILGLAARAMRKERQLEWCQWHGTDGSVIRGELRMLYGEEHHEMTYETVVLNCELNEDVKSGGGYLKGSIDHEHMYLYSEPQGALVDLIPSNGFEYNLVFCGPPMYGEMNERLVREWLEYHHLYLGADHFVLYDAGAVSPTMLQAIDDPFVQKGLVSITNFRESNLWDVWLWAQALAIHDCSYRMRPLAKWVFMQDFDEFLHVAPPQTLKEVLAKYEDRAWITHGCIVFSIEYCTEDAKKYVGASGQESSDGSRGSSDGGMLIAPMQLRWPHIYCQKPGVDNHMCIDQWGHRKYIVNPRKAKLFQIHIVIENEQGMMGVDTSVHELRHLHFQGLAKRGLELCQKGPPKDWWLHYSGVETVCRAVTTCRNQADPQSCILREVEQARKEKKQEKRDASAQSQEQAAGRSGDEQAGGN